VLTLNAFVGHLYPFLAQHSQAEDMGIVRMRNDKWAMLDTYWTKIVYGFAAIVFAWLADHNRSRRGILATICMVAGLCVVSIAFVRKPTLILFYQIVFGIVQTTAEVLSVSLISDMLPWPEVFVGVSWFFLSRYLGFALNNAIIELFHASKLGGGRSFTIGTGIVGIGVAICILFIVRESKRQRGLVVSSDHQQETTASISVLDHKPGIWTNIRATIKHMAHLRSLWLITLGATLMSAASATLHSYLPIYLQNVNTLHSNLPGSYSLIHATTGSISVLCGGFVTCLIYRFSQHEKWNEISLWITALALFLSAPFAVVAVLSKEDMGVETGISVLRGTLATSLTLSEFGVGVLPTLIVALLPPGYKTLGFAICDFVCSNVSAAVVELVRIGLHNAISFQQGFERNIKIILVAIVPVCQVFSAACIYASARLVSVDMEAINSLEELMSAWRMAVFVMGATAIVVLVIGIVPFSVRY